MAVERKHAGRPAIRAPRGAQRRAKSWQTEAPLRMLMNNLDPEVAERPEDLVVYGGIGRAARNWACYDRIVSSLETLNADETLLVQSGKPVGVFRTHPDAPRVLIANSNLVPHWATWEQFDDLDRRGLMMFGQMTAGSWIYIGSQGIVQGTYETFVEVGRQHFNGDLRGRWFLTAGWAGWGRAAAGRDDGGRVDARGGVSSDRIERRLATGYLDRGADNLDQALGWIQEACARREPVSVGLRGNAAEVLPELLARGVRPDAVTDQTSAHDPLRGYLPAGWTLTQWEQQQTADPSGVRSAAIASDGAARRGDARLQGTGHPDVRLWQQHPADGGRGRPRPCLRDSRLRAGLPSPAVLPRRGPVSLGGALGKSGGHLQDRPARQGG